MEPSLQRRHCEGVVEIVDLESGRLELGQIVLEELLILLSDGEEVVGLAGDLLVGTEIYDKFALQL